VVEDRRLAAVARPPARRTLNYWIKYARRYERGITAAEPRRFT
jgi:hypothetical protein